MGVRLWNVIWWDYDWLLLYDMYGNILIYKLYGSFWELFGIGFEIGVLLIKR